MLAARFRRMNIPALVIEKNDRVGDHWRRRYPTLALHTNRYQHTCKYPVVLLITPVYLPRSAVLYQPFPDSWPVYTPRDKLADWMEHYVRSQELIVWTNSEVLPQPSYDPKTKRWHVEINRNGARVVLNPAHIVVAIVALCQEAAMLTMKQDIHAPFVCSFYVVREDIQLKVSSRCRTLPSSTLPEPSESRSRQMCCRNSRSGEWRAVSLKHDNSIFRSSQGHSDLYCIRWVRRHCSRYRNQGALL